MSMKTRRKEFLAVVEAQPLNASAWRGLGLAEQRSGHLAQAIPHYQQMAQLEPSGANYLLLAQAYQLAGQAEAARAAQSQAAAVSPNLDDDNGTVQRLLTQ